MVLEGLRIQKAPTISIAATNNGLSVNNPKTSLALNSEERDLLDDPALVDNFADILKIRPLDYRHNASHADQEESESASGSVVVTPKSSTASPSKQRVSTISTGSSHYSMQDEPDELDKPTPSPDGNENVLAIRKPVGLGNDETSQEEVVRGSLMGQSTGIEEHNLSHITEQEEVSNGSKKTGLVNEFSKAGLGELENKDDLFTGNKGLGNIDSVGNTESSEISHDYDYSDSDFEEDMEKRLQDLSASPSSLEKTDSKRSGEENYGDDDDDDDDDESFKGLDLGSSDDDEKELDDDGVKMVRNGDEGTSKDKENEEDEEDEEDEEIDLYRSQYPPKELDPEKLYALYAFYGQDPSHCQLEPDEPCMLLNDQDSYWWLVKRYSDNKIGFAPAELLETFPERLARLNCWKNENMSSESLVTAKCSTKEVVNNMDFKTLKDKEVSNLNRQDTTDGNDSQGLRDYKKGNKSVSFSDVIGYAERYIEDEMEGDEDSTSKHRDEFTEVNLSSNKLLEDDDASEVVSDVSFNTGSMPPLNIKKVRRPEIKNENSNETVTERDKVESNRSKGHLLDAAVTEGDEDSLRKVFEAPVIPFAKSGGRNNGGTITNSNSDYSISTIGEFSPSSSEWTNDSPQLLSDKFQTDPAAIPSSRAIQDFSKFVESTPEEDDSISEDNKNINDQDSNELSPEIEGSNSNSSQHNKNNSISVTSSLSSSDEFLMDTARAASSASINSASSATKQIFNNKHHTGSVNHVHHPFVHQLYNPVFLKMDDLLRQLDDIINN